MAKQAGGLLNVFNSWQRYVCLGREDQGGTLYVVGFEIVFIVYREEIGELFYYMKITETTS